MFYNDVQHKLFKLSFKKKYLTWAFLTREVQFFFTKTHYHQSPNLIYTTMAIIAKFVHQPIEADLFCIKQLCMQQLTNLSMFD
jgi:hypothetical protein